MRGVLADEKGCAEKMIELRVEGYCHDCPDFEADVTTTKDIFEGRYDPVAGEHKDWAYVRTTIRCSHANRCRAVKRYLEKQQKGE